MQNHEADHDQVLSSQSCAKKYASQDHSQSWRREGAQWRSQEPSKVATEKARGTYRKTAARFEEFAYDAQMPESMRALAEKSVAQTRELYVHSLEAVLEGWERFVVAAGQGTLALNRKAIDITRRNINNGFGLAERLAGAKNLAEAMELQTSYWRKQVGELASQAGEMRTLTTRVTADGIVDQGADNARMKPAMLSETNCGLLCSLEQSIKVHDAAALEPGANVDRVNPPSAADHIRDCRVADCRTVHVESLNVHAHLLVAKREVRQSELPVPRVSILTENHGS